MNTTPFMDKQIMDLTHGSTTQSKEFIDLMKPQQDDQEEEHQHHRHLQEDEDEARGNGISKDDIVPSYDFQPIRPLSASNYDSAPNFAAAFSRAWNSDSNSNSSPPIVKNYGSLDSIEPAKVIVEKDRNAFDATMLSEIDRTMKNHMETMLHVLEGVSARLTQLETRTHHLENSVDDLKVSVGNNHGSTDGKLRQLENILQEVQSGVQTIKDKQDIVQAQLQLAKLQVSKTEQQSEMQTSVITESTQQAASAPLQSQQQVPAPANLPQSIPVVPPPNAPPQPPPQQGLPPPVQPPNQFPQNQILAAHQRDQYFPPPVPSQETPNQQYQLPLAQQPHPQPGAPPHQQQYQQTPHPQYPQPAPHLPQQQPSLPPMNPPQLPPSSLGHHVEEPPYVPPQNYPPNARQPPSQSPSGPPPSQPFYGTPPHTYEQPSSRSGSGYSSGYGTLSAPAEPYRYGGPPQYGGSSALKPQQLPTASVAPSGGSGYPQLPTARVLPQAIPTASAVSGGSGSAGTGSRVSIDDVVDKVATMGFPRDHVRATVRKLTENGQSVDLNAVLDKLMNDSEIQPPARGWFGR
ncbi:bromodomain-containing protein 4 [Abrus precatorius]|uniref:Bromodomain-containing protein 4 n=1 Tax=Abrus precatorius TaxID=3816 RepID=A0A8B8LR56_ABRPR|nr:bromodomain-containing protein 4 [Abrus precatorius]